MENPSVGKWFKIKSRSRTIFFLPSAPTTADENSLSLAWHSIYCLARQFPLITWRLNRNRFLFANTHTQGRLLRKSFINLFTISLTIRKFSCLLYLSNEMFALTSAVTSFTPKNDNATKSTWNFGELKKGFGSFRKINVWVNNYF